MAVTSWTQDSETIYIDVANTASVVLSGATGTVSMPTMKIKYNSSILSDSGRASVTDARLSYGSRTRSWSSGQSAVVGRNVYATVPWTAMSIDTSDVFSVTNKNDITATGYVKLVPYIYPTGTTIDIAGMGFTTSINRTIVTYTITLDVPPTIGTVTGSYSSPQYAGLGTYTADIASASAAYGGDVASITLTVGPDSVTQTYSSSTISSETISLVPSAAGTYTPTITVEDSRGQTNTKSLTQITVNPYVAPSLSFDVFRTNSAGVKDDEGAYGLISAAVTFTDAIATLTQPAVTIDGTLTNSVTWYAAYNSSTGVSSAISDWTTVSSGDTIYGLINGSFSGSQSYVIGVVITDSEGGNSPNITQTLSTAFYTIDFQAGGKEIAFGAPANDNLSGYPDGLFKCQMDALYNNSLVAQDMSAQEVDDFVDNLSVGGGGVAVDLVIEEGTSGFWTYRKWNSGIAECWGRTTEAKAFSSWGSIYSCDLSAESYPLGLFISTPTCVASFGNGTANAVASARGLPSSTETYQGVAVRGTSVSGTITWTKSYYAIGTWR